MRISMYSFAAVFILGFVSERCLQARHAVHDLRVQRSARGFGLDLGIASSLFIRLICVLRVRVVSPRRGEGCAISH